MLTREEYERTHSYDEYVKKELQREEERLEELNEELKNLQSYSPRRYCGAVFLGLLTLASIFIAWNLMLIGSSPELRGVFPILALFVGLIVISCGIAAEIFSLWEEMYNCWPFGKVQKAPFIEKRRTKLEHAIAESKKEIACLRQVLTA